MRQRVWIAAVVALALAKPAHAYLDPATGSMILQGLIAAIAALALTVRLWWRRLLSLLGVRKREGEGLRAPEAGEGRDTKRL